MSNKLYQIEEELDILFAQIEENGGELDEETLNKLNITENNFMDKLSSYYKAICVWESDSKACKEEESRISKRRKVYENRITRLKASLLDAVCKYGQSGKTNKFIELPTVRFFTSNTKAIEVDNTRVQILINAFCRLVNELNEQGVLYTGEDVDLKGILESINANVIAEQGDDFEPFTISDITELKIKVSTTNSIVDLLTTSKVDVTALDLITNMNATLEVINDTPKESWKVAIHNEKDITLAKEVTNTSLRMK